MTRQTNWRDELRGAIRTLDALKTRFPAMEITGAMRAAAARHPMCVTPHYASLIQTPDFTDPIFAQCVPDGRELLAAPHLAADPLCEQACSPSPLLIRRYPDRALLLASGECGVACRHCFRKRIAAAGAPALPRVETELDAVAAFLAANPEIDDVLISGGDPLTLPDKTLDHVLARLRAVKSVKMIRIATRALAAFPSRVTAPFARMLARRGPVLVNTHFNHPRELAPQALSAAARLVDAGVLVGSQTVLLRGVNDDPHVMEALFRALYHNRIRPYYMFQCDLVSGVEHLRTPLKTGLEIMRHLRKNLSGPAIPNFAVDAPRHGGKIELLPQSLVSETTAGALLLDGGGKEFFHPNPAQD